MKICRFVVGRRLTPRRVEMRHPRGDHRARFEK
jgi:hypothetical protein